MDERCTGDDPGTPMEQMGRVLGRVFRVAREELELSVEEVSLLARVAPATVRRVEAGEIAPFTLNSLERIGRALDLDLRLELTPLVDELVVVASAVEAPVHVFARLPAPLDLEPSP